MKKNLALLFFPLVLLMPLKLHALNSYYCQKAAGHIEVGMAEHEVITACGQPLRKENSHRPFTKSIPVIQLIYNNKGTDTAFFGVYNIPVGYGGARLEVDIAHNKVVAIRINGAETNAFSICDGNNILIGDMVAQVYNSCGSPSLVNTTYINQVQPGLHNKEIWTYQEDQYQHPVHLTFVNRQLQSIDQ